MSAWAVLATLVLFACSGSSSTNGDTLPEDDAGDARDSGGAPDGGPLADGAPENDAHPPVTTGDAAAGDGDACSGDACCNPSTVATDPHNCGACGHDCLGGACTAGVCQPVVVASGQVRPNRVLVDATNIYWSISGAENPAPTGALVTAPIAGGAPTTLISKRVGIDQFLVTPTTLYWTANVIVAMPLGGGATQNLYPSGSDFPDDLAIDATHLYWTGLDRIMSAPLANTGATPTTLASAEKNPFAIAIDAANVYWTNDLTSTGTVKKIPLAGDPNGPTTLASGLNRPRSIAVDATTVYFGSEGGGVEAVPIAGGAPQTIAGNLVVSGLAVDATTIYWSSPTDGTVSSVPKGGGKVTTLATGQVYPGWITVDATSVYWIDRGTSDTTPGGSGSIMRVVKP